MFLGTQKTADETITQADQHMYVIKHALKNPKEWTTFKRVVITNH